MRNKRGTQSAKPVGSGDGLGTSPWFPLTQEKMAALQKQVMDETVPKTETEWWARREIIDLLEFVKEQMSLWDNDGDCGFPLYEHGKRIIERHVPNDQAHPTAARASVGGTENL